MALLDIAGDYLNSRFGQGSDTFNQFGQETDEERRRREMAAEEELRRKNLESLANPTPVTQTVKTDPITGEQEMTIKGRPEDLSARNPMTPTVSGPAVPGQAAPVQMPPALHPDIQSKIDQVMPPAQVSAVAPNMPAVTDQSQLNNKFNYPMVGPGLSQPMLGVNPANKEIYTDMPVGARVGINNEEIVGPNGQTYNYNQLQNAADDLKYNIEAAQANPVTPPQTVATTQPMVAPAAPVAPTAPTAPAATMPGAEAPGVITPVAPGQEPAPRTQPAVSPAVTTTAPNADVNVNNQLNTWQDNLENAKSADDWESIMTNPATPKSVRQFAATRFSETQKKTDEEKRAETIVTKAVSGDPKAQTDLTRALRQKSEEGSYIKAYLFSRLGLNELAQAEQAKLIGGNKIAAISGPEGQRYTAEYNAQGAVINAYDAEGNRVDATTLSRINAESFGAKGVETGMSLYKDANGDTITASRVPGRAGLLYTNNTTGKTSFTAPEGLVPIGQKSLERMTEEKALSEAAREEDRMRKENSDARSYGIAPPHSESDITAAKERVLRNAAATRPTAPATVESGTLRNNNPGNIKYGPMAKEAGATGQDSRGFAIFPDTSSGFAAQEKLWTSPAYKNLTLGQAIAKWAPNTENNPAEYLRTMKQKTGLDMDKEFKDLTAEQKQTFLTAQAELEHGVKLSPGGGTGTSTASPSSIAYKIATYQLKPPSSYSKGYGPLMQEVAKMNPDFDATKYETAAKTRKDFATGKQGQTVQSMNVAIDHLDTLKDTADALKNGNLPLFNRIAQDFAENTGNPAPTDFDTVKSIVGSEVAKAVSGANMALADREEIRKEIDRARSPAQLASSIRRLQELLGGQIKGLKQTWISNGLKPEEFDQKITKRTKEVLYPKEKDTTPRSNW